MLSYQCKTEYAIYFHVDCSESEAFAAYELAHYLNRITGARFAALCGKPAGKKIIVGDMPILNELGIDISAENLGDEGFIIRTVGETLIIAGGAKRGTLYGVYTFLEDALGCRWYTDVVTRIPKRYELPLMPLNIRQVPALEYRETFYPCVAGDAAWSACNKNNGNSSRLYPHQGGKISYYPFVHTFDQILSPKDHFDAHPEYFSMVDGERIGEKEQLCLTNPDVVRLSIQKVREWIAEHPDATIISVSQNDWYNPCQCPDCRMIDEREGSYAGTLIHYINQIAEAIEEESPHIVIDTLAYQYTRTPPKHIRPRPNVCVRLCTIECCFAHPLDECDRVCSFAHNIHGDSFQADLEGWAKVCDRLYVWDYVVNFHHYAMPFPNFGVLAPNIRYFIRNNVKGIFEEGSTTPYGGAEFAQLKAWVIAKLLWNPELDTQALAEDFIGGYYGGAARYILAYYNLLNEALRAVPDAHFGIYDPPRNRYLTDEVIQKAKALFDRAELMADDPEVLERVKTARIPIRYWELLVMDVDTPGRFEAVEQFRNDLAERNYMEIFEFMPLDFSIEKLHGGLKFRFPE